LLRSFVFGSAKLSYSATPFETELSAFCGKIISNDKFYSYFLLTGYGFFICELDNTLFKNDHFIELTFFF